VNNGSLGRRLEALEGRMLWQRRPESSTASSARERMKAHLDRLAALRRGELSEEEAAEVEALNAAFRRRLAAIRGKTQGEGGS
jgi:hypothetical protein